MTDGQDPHVVVQLTQSATVVVAQSPKWERLRSEFRAQHGICFPGLFERRVLQSIQSRLDRADFYRREHPGIGVELCLGPDPTISLLHFLVNDFRFLQVIRQVTECGPIGSFTGRVYRVVPGLDHYDSWHSDTQDETRMIGMSINLSRDLYSGGLFQLRRSDSTEILFEKANTGPGDAIVFRLAPHLVHQITTVGANAPKTAFAGWFVSRPTFTSWLGASVAAAPPR